MWAAESGAFIDRTIIGLWELGMALLVIEGIQMFVVFPHEVVRHTCLVANLVPLIQISMHNLLSEEQELARESVG